MKLFLDTKQNTADSLKDLLLKNHISSISLLDAGCGRGDFEYFLIRNQIPIKQIISVDISPEQLAVTKSIIKNESNYIVKLQDYRYFDLLQYPDLNIISFFQSLPDNPISAFLVLVQNFSDWLKLSNKKVWIVPTFPSNPGIDLGISCRHWLEANLINWITVFSEHFSVRVYKDLYLLECTAFEMSQDCIERIKQVHTEQEIQRQSSAFEDIFKS